MASIKQQFKLTCSILPEGEPSRNALVGETRCLKVTMMLTFDCNGDGDDYGNGAVDDEDDGNATDDDDNDDGGHDGGDDNDDKNGLILPTGQWYAPSAVINDAWYCMVLHCIA